MKKISILLFVFAASNLFAQNMRQNSFNSLFSDQKANTVGDAVTILVIESSQASNNAETSAGKSSDLGFNLGGTAAGTDVPNVDVDIGSNNNFVGKGSTKTSGVVRTKISATVDSVLNNGNLMIRGTRKITINGEEQTVLIKGIIRSSDIMADNSVFSYNISESEIMFEGSGMIDNAQSPGWLTKLFHWLF